MLALNPRGQLPILKDGGGVVINESLAAILYLEEVYTSGTQLLPADPEAKAKVRGHAGCRAMAGAVCLGPDSYFLSLREVACTAPPAPACPSVGALSLRLSEAYHCCLFTGNHEMKEAPVGIPSALGGEVKRLTNEASAGELRKLTAGTIGIAVL